MNQQILNSNGDMLLSCGYEPSSLANGCVPVDIDVSPFDNSGSHKAGVSRTYKNFDGYAPIFAYIGTEGYLNPQSSIDKYAKNALILRR